jgi:hypothetical protein
VLCRIVPAEGLRIHTCFPHAIRKPPHPIVLNLVQDPMCWLHQESLSGHYLNKHLRVAQWLCCHVLVNLDAGNMLRPILPLLDEELPLNLEQQTSEGPLLPLQCKKPLSPVMALPVQWMGSVISRRRSIVLEYLMQYPAITMWIREGSCIYNWACTLTITLKTTVSYYSTILQYNAKVLQYHN